MLESTIFNDRKSDSVVICFLSFTTRVLLLHEYASFSSNLIFTLKSLLLLNDRFQQYLYAFPVSGYPFTVGD